MYSIQYSYNGWHRHVNVFEEKEKRNEFFFFGDLVLGHRDWMRRSSQMAMLPWFLGYILYICQGTLVSCCPPVIITQLLTFRFRFGQFRGSFATPVDPRRPVHVSLVITAGWVSIIGRTHTAHQAGRHALRHAGPHETWQSISVAAVNLSFSHLVLI